MKIPFGINIKPMWFIVLIIIIAATVIFGFLAMTKSPLNSLLAIGGLALIGLGIYAFSWKGKIVSITCGMLLFIISMAM